MTLKMGLLILAVGAVVPGAAAAQEGSSGTGEGVYFPYPAESLRLREEGVVRYRVKVSSKGLLESCQVVQSSGYTRLDRATCQMLTMHAEFKPKRDVDGRKISSVREGQIVWKIS
ncbi:MAG TPA: energy transducer TonB [Allosphingosinicella sp.]|nr:energy transducer TonB [Allosphingosinicella sp.]